MKKLSDAIDEYLKEQYGEDDLVLVLGVPEDGNTVFSEDGSDIVESLAMDVYENIDMLVGKRDFTKTIDEGKVDVGFFLLDHVHNGTEYYLDEDDGNWYSEDEIEIDEGEDEEE